jgi:hypothetical protein
MTWAAAGGLILALGILKVTLDLGKSLKTEPRVRQPWDC